MTAITLHNLRCFAFQGAGTYLGAILHRITAPLLEGLQIDFFNQLTFSVPRLLQFVSTTGNITFKCARFEFGDEDIVVKVYHHEQAKRYALSITVDCYHDRQVSSVAQISSSVRPTFSGVEHLTLGHSVHSQLSEEHNEADPTYWHKIQVI